MTPMQVSALVAKAASVFHIGEKDLRATAAVWYEVLGHLPNDLAKAALTAYLVHGTFFPTPADILRCAADLQGEVDGALPAPEEAWAEVLRVIRRIGYLGTPTFTHEAIHKAMYALHGGWSNLCRELDEKTIVADRVHFQKMYATYTQRERFLRSLPEQVARLGEGLAEKLRLEKTMTNPTLSPAREEETM